MENVLSGDILPKRLLTELRIYANSYLKYLTKVEKQPFGTV
jgi:hypothetical protein